MSDLALIGRHLIVGLGDSYILPEEKLLLRELKPSGVIIFRHNIAPSSDWPQRLALLLSEFAGYTEHADGCITSIDHEGGKVNRLPAPATAFPSAYYWGDHTGAVATAMGRELHALGFNLNFAPVADVWTEPTNTVIGRRAFSNITDVVARRAIDFLRSMEKAGVSGCAKHFPGHGGTSGDSHFELPVIESASKSLLECEIKPFEFLIENGLHAIMTSHVLYKSLDPDHPATLSKKIINDLLRSQLGYSGVVISDALEMGALSQHRPGDALCDFIVAGGDLALYGMRNHELALVRARRAVEQVMNMSLKHHENSSKLCHSLDRSLTASAIRIGNFLKYLSTIKAFPKENTTNIVNSAKHQALAQMLNTTQLQG